MLRNKSFFLRDTGAVPEFVAAGTDTTQYYKFNACTSSTCGQTSSNPTKFTMKSGGVIISANGEIEIGITALKVRTTGAAAGQKTLEVFLGNLVTTSSPSLGTSTILTGTPLGTITTDANGNYSGPISVGLNKWYKSPAADSVMLNTPGVRTEFLALGTSTLSNFKPCTEAICGFDINTATLRMDAGDVEYLRGGQIRINVFHLRDAATNAIKANTTLDVFLGNFPGPYQFNGGRAGRLTTDANGNFNGIFNGSSVQATPVCSVPSTVTRLPVNMQIPRGGKSATLLSDGRILLFGGYENQDSNAFIAEVFDPATGRITRTGNEPFHARRLHTATVLNDGRVLLVGGIGFSRNGASFTAKAPIAEAEIYDPTTNQFTIRMSLPSAPIAHDAVKLENGKVFVTPGASGSGALSNSTAYIFNPQTNLFQSVSFPNPVTNLDWTASIVPDSGSSKVLLVPGETVPWSTNNLLSRIFDTRTGTFSTISTSFKGLGNSGLLPLANGKLFYSATAYTSAPFTSYAFPVVSYDPASQVLSALPSSAAFIQGGPVSISPSSNSPRSVLLAGGLSRVGNLVILNSAEIYNPVSGTYSQLAARLPEPRDFYQAVHVPSRCETYLFGGRKAVSTPQTYLTTIDVLK